MFCPCSGLPGTRQDRQCRLKRCLGSRARASRPRAGLAGAAEADVSSRRRKAFSLRPARPLCVNLGTIGMSVFAADCPSAMRSSALYYAHLRGECWIPVPLPPPLPERPRFSGALGAGQLGLRWHCFSGTSGPRGGPLRRLRSLTGRFSLELCTIAVRYRASQAHVFGHLRGAKFEVLSLHQVGRDGVAGRGDPNV
jgi:hypothetical protein